MKRAAALVLILGCVVPAFGQPREAGVTAASRLLGDGTRSLLFHIREATGPAIDEVRIDLARGAVEGAVALGIPAGWKSQREGSALRLSGNAATLPIRLRIALFDARDPGSTRVRLRMAGRNVWEGSITPLPLPTLTTEAIPAGFVQIPSIVSPGREIEFQVLDPKRTPPDGQWLVAGVAATPAGENRLRVQLPSDLLPGSPLRVTYFDAWGERILDALAPRDVVVTSPTNPAQQRMPRITGCAQYGFRGQGICVCGNFPESSRAGLTIDGQTASVLSASQDVIHVRIPESLAPGPHVIAGDPAAGFSNDDRASMRALVLQASIDSKALMRGESTTMRLAIDGAAEPLWLAVTNRTPGIISIPGGNYQEIELPPDVNRPVDRRVDARSPGNFTIDTDLTLPPCPCMQQPEQLSTASQPAPVFVPRRVLATIAVAAPPVMLATAQALALANGLSVVEVTPLPLAGAALAVFEIQDGIGAIAKAAALAADPNVLLAQPDFVYDTFQASASLPGIAYGSRLIGADVAGQVATGDGVRVAVIDAGLDSNHPSLTKKVAEFVDVTGTGWTPDAHGTLVAGVIAAEGGDAGAPLGIAPGVALVAVKSCVALSIRQAAARCWSSTLARGIDAASRRNVQVMNLSVGGPEDRLLTRMVEAAASKGIAVVSAAGNDGPTGKPSYPAAIEHVIAVTAVDAASQLYGRATHGRFIDVAAPGVDILSTGPGGRSLIFSGTSAATAFTTGAVALLLQRSKLTPADVATLLRSTAKDLGQPGRDAQFGDGLIDVCRAVVRASGRQAPCR